MIAASQIFTQKTFCEQKNHNKKMEFTTNFFMYSDNLLFLLKEKHKKYEMNRIWFKSCCYVYLFN